MIIQRVARGTALSMATHPGIVLSTDISGLEFAARSGGSKADGVESTHNATPAVVDHGSV